MPSGSQVAHQARGGAMGTVNVPEAIPTATVIVCPAPGAPPLTACQIAPSSVCAFVCASVVTRLVVHRSVAPSAPRQQAASPFAAAARPAGTCTVAVTASKRWAQSVPLTSQ